MAGNIKGITIEFNGDTTKLDKALRQINNETKSLDKELKQVDKALKFNPTSVELWRQKQEILTQKLNETKNKLDVLKQAQAQMDANGVDKNSEEYRKLQREIIETESKVKTFEAQLRKIGNVNLRAMSEQFKDMGNKLTAAGHAMQGLSTAAAAVAASIGAVTVKSGKWADDINTMSKVYSIGTKELQMYSAAADLVDVSVETIAKSHVKLEKTMYSAANGSKTQAEAYEKLGVEIQNADGTLRSSDDVFNDVISALGKMTDETERDAIAQQLMGKSAAELNPLIEDGGETYKNVAETMQKYGLDFIDQDTLNQANEFNDALDTMKLVGMTAFQQLGTQLAAYLAPAMEKVVDVVGRLAEWFSNLSPRTQALIAGIAAVVAVLAPLLIGLGKVSFAISSIMSLAATLTPIIAGIGTTILPIIAIIAALIAIGVLLYKNWDVIKAKAIAIWTSVKTTIVNTWNTIKTSIQNAINTITSAVTSKFEALKSSVSTIWSNIKSAITKPIQEAKDTISGVVDKIKGLFPINIGNILKNVKTPHFTLEWGSKDFGKLGTISYPKGFNVSWYAQGGIFDAPTIAGIGEAGPEAVVPLDRFWKTLEGMNTGETNITININGVDKDPREIAEEVKRVLIKEVNNRRLAWQ